MTLTLKASRPRNFNHTFQCAGETSIKMEHVEQWLEETDPRYKLQSVEETAQEALKGETEHGIDSEDDANTPALPKPSPVRSSLDTIITYVDLINSKPRNPASLPAFTKNKRTCDKGAV